MKAIVLEILRDGPAHNQLLSPLTKYLALCGEHAASPLQVMFEHAQLLARFAGLSYRDSERTRQLQLAEMSSAMAALVGQVPGLLAELAKARVSLGATANGRRPMVHLRLVLNANELALLPLELAGTPAGHHAVGQPLVMQTEVPICVTREVRRASEVSVRWDRKPRILFAFANPEGDVPFEQHLLALRRAIDPWLDCGEHASQAEQRAAVMRHLTVLPRASVRSIEDACRRESFTHVHILAHGAGYQRGEDSRFGLALHDATTRTRLDIVSGERLAAALRPHANTRYDSLAEPLIVTVASCDSGNVGTVVGTGASIAHELHLRGIPLVVASQFPLTIPGSIHMVRVLYERLLWGHDPRTVLDDLRRQLMVLVPDSHDWASVVAYAAFPGDLTTQCERFAMNQAEASIEAALRCADDVIVSLSARTSGRHGARDIVGEHQETMRIHPDPFEYLFKNQLQKLQEAGRRLRELIDSAAADTHFVWGRLGAMEKRIAELYARTDASLDRHQISSVNRPNYLERARRHLELSSSHYRESFAADRGSAWALVQGISLELVLDRWRTDQWSERWALALLLSATDLENPSRERQVWACANLLELHVQASILEVNTALSVVAPRAVRAAGDHMLEARRYAARIVSLTRGSSFERFSAARQMLRYTEFFARLNGMLSEVEEPVGVVYEQLVAP